MRGGNPAGVTTYEKRTSTFKRLACKLANLTLRLANVCSPPFCCERLTRKLRLIAGLCVPLDFGARRTAYRAK
jgi:hypothetical protein